MNRFICTEGTNTSSYVDYTTNQFDIRNKQHSFEATYLYQGETTVCITGSHVLKVALTWNKQDTKRILTQAKMQAIFENLNSCFVMELTMRCREGNLMFAESGLTQSTQTSCSSVHVCGGGGPCLLSFGTHAQTHLIHSHYQSYHIIFSSALCPGV